MWLHPPFFSMQMLHFGQSCDWDWWNVKIISGSNLCVSRDVVGSFTVVGTLGQPPNVNIIYSSNSVWRHLEGKSNLSVISIELVTSWLYRSQLAHGKNFHIWSKIWEGLSLIVVFMNASTWPCKLRRLCSWQHSLELWLQSDSWAQGRTAG